VFLHHLPAFADENSGRSCYFYLSFILSPLNISHMIYDLRVMMATQFGVSRTPLREALNRLNIEGFTRFSPGEGYMRSTAEK
jgi:hypothetical protein